MCVVWAAAAVAASAAPPADAEPLRVAQAFEHQAFDHRAFGAEVLPPYEVVTIVRSAGLDPLTRPFLRGRDYVIRAIDRHGREVRVVVDARRGEIMRVAPVAVASRGLTMGPYQRMDGYAPPPDRYVEPGDAGEPPSVVYGDEPADADAPRPPAAVPGVPSARAMPAPVTRAAPVRGAELHPLPEPRVITADPNGAGPLPPPPERFRQSTAKPAAKPKPVTRNVASIPKNAPLPKPRPQVQSESRPGGSAAANASAPTASMPAAPAAQPSASSETATEKTPVPAGNGGSAAPAPASNPSPSPAPAAPVHPADEVPN
jgi:hypothetical protein